MPYSKVERQIWDDERFRAWPKHTRDTWFYILTGRHQNRLGMFVLDPRYVAADAQITEAEARESLQQLHASGRIMYDPATRLCLVVRHFKHNDLANPNVVRAAVEELDSLPFERRMWEGLQYAIQRFGKLKTEKGTPYHSILAEAVQAQLDGRADATAPTFLNPSPNASPNPLGNPSPNASERAVRNGVSKPFGEPFDKGLGKHCPNPEPEPEPEPEQEPEPKSSSAATTSTRAQAHTGEASPADLDELASRVILTANRGMLDNPAIGERMNPIVAGHGSRQYVLDWLANGISPDVILATVYDVALHYAPNGGTSRQISTMAYFDGAVYEASIRYQSGSVAVPPALPEHVVNGTPRQKPKPDGEAARGAIDGGDTLRQRREQEAADERRQAEEVALVASWAERHLERAASVRTMAEKYIASQNGNLPLGEQLRQKMIDADYRKRVLRILQAQEQTT